MKIIETPDATWSKKFTCDRCGTKFEADQGDLKIDSFKISGYHFAGTAVCEDKIYVRCPTDNKIAFVKEKNVPVIVRDKIPRG